MTAFLSFLLGRLPIGWLQLIHHPARFAAALAGVSIANILVFMQLGFLGALTGTIHLPYNEMDADLLVSASDMKTLADSNPLPRQRMFAALSVPGVAAAAPLYHGKTEWKQPDGTVRILDVFGVNPSLQTFRSLTIDTARSMLHMAETALLDRNTRNVSESIFTQLDAGHPYRFETRGHTLTVIGTVNIGGGFSSDGYLIVSEQTFLRLFPERSSATPNHILLRLEPRVDQDKVLQRLRTLLPTYDSVVRTVATAAAAEEVYQTTAHPIGLIFGFGIIIGVLVGSIIVYQILSNDVADHIKEYATFKAIGYDRRFFLSIVFEEALILGLLGFIPGFALSLVLYAAVSATIELPVIMSAERASLVLFGTLLLSMLSGALATRRLTRANPADLF